MKIKDFESFIKKENDFIDIEYNGLYSYKNRKSTISKSELEEIKEIFRYRILDEYQMIDLSGKSWVHDDDSIHEIWPEFTGEIFYSLDMDELHILFAKYVFNPSRKGTSIDLDNFINDIKNFGNEIKSMGYEIGFSLYQDIEDSGSRDEVYRLKMIFKRLNDI